MCLTVRKWDKNIISKNIQFNVTFKRCRVDTEEMRKHCDINQFLLSRIKGTL